MTLELLTRIGQGKLTSTILGTLFLSFGLALAGPALADSLNPTEDGQDMETGLGFSKEPPRPSNLESTHETVIAFPNDWSDRYERTVTDTNLLLNVTNHGTENVRYVAKITDIVWLEDVTFHQVRHFGSDKIATTHDQGGSPAGGPLLLVHHDGEDLVRQGPTTKEIYEDILEGNRVPAEIEFTVDPGVNHILFAVLGSEARVTAAPIDGDAESIDITEYIEDDELMRTGETTTPQGWEAITTVHSQAGGITHATHSMDFKFANNVILLFTFVTGHYDLSLITEDGHKCTWSTTSAFPPLVPAVAIFRTPTPNTIHLEGLAAGSHFPPQLYYIASQVPFQPENFDERRNPTCVGDYEPPQET